MTETSTLFVTWFDPTMRGILPVGRLVRRREAGGPVYEFSYIRGAIEAKKRGFSPFLAFPELGCVYRSRRLFAFFGNRLMPSTRADYLDYVRSLALESEGSDELSILGRSGGRRETDRIELIAAPVRDDRTGMYTTHFLARGIAHTPGAEARVALLAAGDRLLWMLDAQNEANPNAVALRTEDRYLVGYLPDYLITDIVELVARRAPMDVRVERVNLPPAPVHYRLLCRLTAAWPEGFEPFAGERFEPLVAEEVRGEPGSDVALVR
jgi:hypothetical protein